LLWLWLWLWLWLDRLDDGLRAAVVAAVLVRHLRALFLERVPDGVFVRSRAGH
jgi:hypothetical protein